MTKIKIIKSNLPKTKIPKLSLKYIVCPICGNILDLSHMRKKCPNPNCHFGFGRTLKYFGKDSTEIHKALKQNDIETNSDEYKCLEVAIRNNMASYLKHFIECNWGAHHNTLFKKLIEPYLDDIEPLKTILSSNIINEKKCNVTVSKNGYKMFWDLYRCLAKVRSGNVRHFLVLEFPEYNKKLYKILHDQNKQAELIARNSNQPKLF